MMDRKEIDFTCALANPYIRMKLSSFYTEIPWNSPLAMQLILYFHAPGVADRPFDPLQFRMALHNFCLEGEVEYCLKTAEEFVKRGEDIDGFISAFTSLYKTRYVTQLLEDHRGNVDGLLSGFEKMREINASNIPVWRLGELDIDQVIHEDMGSIDALPTTVDFIRDALEYKGYLRGELVMVCAPPGCMVGETKIVMVDHAWKTLEDIYRDGDTNILVYACDKNGQIRISVAEKCQLTRYVTSLVEVVIDHTTTLKVTSDHLFLLLDGSYIQAKNVEVGMSFMPFHRGQLARGNVCVTNVQCISCETQVPVYDLINVDTYANYAVMTGENTGIFSHNCGKAQPLDSPIITPTGVKRMGDMTVGSVVCTPNGKTATVRSVHPQGSIDVYRVIFSDGTSTECSNEHLWVTETLRERQSKKSSVKTLEQIRNSLYVPNEKNVEEIPNHCIPQSEPVHFEKRNLPIHPYLFGVLLGNGSFRGTTPSLTLGNALIVQRVQDVLPDDVTLVKNNSSKYGYYLSGGTKKMPNPLTEKLKALGVWGKTSLTKYIPDTYMFSSYEDRIALLCGLMDTCGMGHGNGRMSPTFHTPSSQLAHNVRFLIETLGGIAVISERPEMQNYRVYIRLRVNPFSLPGEIKEEQLQVKYHPRRFIVDVQYVGKKECQCITLDDTENLYLTDHCIVTHNSLFMANECLNFLLNGYKVYWLALGDMMRLDFIQRYTSIAATKHLNALNMPDLKSEFDVRRSILNNLRFSVMRSSEIDIYTVKNYIDTVVAEEDNIDVFVLDYDANLRSFSENMYTEGEIVYSAMTGIARPLHQQYRVCLVASQPSRNYWGYAELGLECAAESARKQANVDTMITIGRDQYNLLRTGTMTLAKARRGNAGAKAEYVLTEYGTFDFNVDHAIIAQNHIYSSNQQQIKRSFVQRQKQNTNWSNP